MDYSRPPHGTCHHPAPGSLSSLLNISRPQWHSRLVSPYCKNGFPHTFQLTFNSSVAFFGDNILSRACHDNVIVLWRIEGFSSADPPPPQSSAPTAQTVVPSGGGLEDQSRLTRSYFLPAVTAECPSQYTRLLEFHTPSCGPQFFMRFSLHHVPGQNPVLAFCNAAGNIFFWDLRRLAAYQDVMLALRDPARDRARPVALPSWLKPVIPRQRVTKLARTTSSSSSRGGAGAGANGANGAEPGHELSQETLASWAAKYSMEDPHEPIKAHRAESSAANFVGRQAAWSPGGEWCVVVGSSNTTLVLQRWAK